MIDGTRLLLVREDGSLGYALADDNGNLLVTTGYRTQYKRLSASGIVYDGKVRLNRVMVSATGTSITIRNGTTVTDDIVFGPLLPSAGASLDFGGLVLDKGIYFEISGSVVATALFEPIGG